MTKKYRYTSPLCPGARVIATYTNCILSGLEGLQNIGILWESIPINSPIPFHERDIKKMAELYDYAVEVQQVEEDQTSVKVAMFCAAYKKHTGLKYQVRKADVAKAAEVPMEASILELYFTNSAWWGKQPKSLSNYVSNYNNLMQLANAKPARAEDQYPAEPDMEYLKKLSPAQGVKVQQFWFKKGWRPVKANTGEIIKWTAPAKVAMLAVMLIFLSAMSGCFIFKKGGQTTETVITEDTIQVPADSLQVLIAWEDFWSIDSSRVVVEDDRQRVELMPIDTADLDSLEGAGWTWFEPSGSVTVNDGFKAKKRPASGRVIGVKAIAKEQLVIDQDTIKKKQPEPIILPGLPVDGNPGLWTVISAVLSAILLVILFIVNRKKNG